jgi:hypothetical protein
MSTDHAGERVVIPVLSMGTSTSRMHALRERRGQNLNLVKIRITKAQIEALVSKGYLDRESCDDLTAREAAAEAWLARPSDAVTINHPAARRSRPKVAGARNPNCLSADRYDVTGADPAPVSRHST